MSKWTEPLSPSRDDPKSIADIAALFLQVLDDGRKVKDMVTEALSETVFKAAAYSMGVEIEGEVTTDSIGLALGKKIKAESGIDLGNVLDGENVKAKLERVAIAAVLADLAVDQPATRQGLADGLRVVIRRRIAEKINSGEAAALVGDVGSQVEVSALLAFIKRRDKPVKQDAFHESLRARQAKFRETHKRVRT